ncbi:hypothetical protein SUGI_0979580 [Cryptomeria japonica]|uniref:BAG family molecular chaperone regulator 7 n=1 Tax=Cryptomeria japonica TaxID=3369 RepID=UPI002414CFCB|nr:BAG family molecular chaperone regulator 7 [Cryptomeria japonica]GLJ46480.1 hypothetical protein SUGI_0979580 [Cryptomeria japonica]
MKGYRGLECYYSSPSVETDHRLARKPSPISLLNSDIEFALTCFESSPFEDFFFSSRNKWFAQIESSFFSFPSKPKESNLAMETWTRKRICKQSYEDYSYVAEVQHNNHDHVLQDLADRVAAMEIAFNKFTKSPVLLPNGTVNKSFKKEWQTENGGKAKFSYKYEANSPAKGEFKAVKTEKFKLSKGDKPKESQIRVIPVEEEDANNNTDAEASRRIQSVFARKRAAAAQEKGKQKELSPMDAALIIQARFREYLVHRSQTLRSLRDLAVAKAKLKELRCLFTNYAYRRHLCRDTEEKQRFSEKIIVLLLTVDSIQGSDHLVREARRSMIQELESMLDTIDPQSSKDSISKRRFDLPEQEPVHKEMEMEVAEVVGLLDEKNGGNLFPYVTL